MENPKEEMYASLFQKIINGDYQRGTRLKEAELAEEYELSRTPVREVLQLLALDGLIILMQNKGAIVQQLSPDDIEEIYDIRRSLELLALEFSIQKINLTELQNIQKNIMDVVMKTDDYTISIESDNILHRYIVESSNKTRLIGMINQLLRIMEKFRYLGFHDHTLSERVCTEHLQIIEALLRRDLPLSKELLSKHLENSKIATLTMFFSGKQQSGKSERE